MTDLPAGPEIDRLIGAIVMGWTFGYENMYDGSDHRPPVKQLNWIEGKIAVRDWTPSTDIAQAWEVIEAIRSKGMGVIVGDNTMGDAKYCSIYPADGYMQPFCETAPTDPFAICRTALKAME